MSLTPRLHLDQKYKHLKGFVDFGNCTPEYLKRTRADHALVFMFRPFRGDWVQVVFFIYIRYICINCV